MNHKSIQIKIVIASIIVLIIILLFFLLIHKQKSKDDYISANYISIKMPTSITDNQYLERKVYTLIYDSNRIVRRIIFTDYYNSFDAAQADYERIVKANNRTNPRNKPKRILKVNDKIITYEFEDDIVEKYYDSFIGRSIDDIIGQYGEDNILKDFKPDISNDELILKNNYENKLTLSEVNN